VGGGARCSRTVANLHSGMRNLDVEMDLVDVKTSDVVWQGKTFVDFNKDQIGRR